MFSADPSGQLKNLQKCFRQIRSDSRKTRRTRGFWHDRAGSQSKRRAGSHSERANTSKNSQNISKKNREKFEKSCVNGESENLCPIILIKIVFFHSNIISGRVSFVNCFGLEVTSHQTKIQWGGLGGSIWAKKIMFSLELGCRFSVDLG